MAYFSIRPELDEELATNRDRNRGYKLMSRRHKHEDHVNHEAWAIPYGDLITLLLAFFVVMYAISTVNEGKYRAVADSLSAAFNGVPRAMDPIQVGDRNTAVLMDSASRLDPQGGMIGEHASELMTSPEQQRAKQAMNADGLTAMDEVINNVEASMAELIQQDLLIVRRTALGVEIEIRTDILFPSGSATLSASATSVLQRLANTLKPLPYPMRVEGHTDNRPIKTAAFPSNWELSAARAATVVRLFMERGVDPTRLSVIGLGEFKPIADNANELGRDINRRVMVVILSNGEAAEAADKLQSLRAAASKPAVTAADNTVAKPPG